MTHHQVIRVAGAGLSGLTTAIGLAEAGWAVEIFEAGHDSGWGRRGAWDAVENWTTGTDFTALLDQWKISRNFECRPVTSFEVYDPHGNCHSVADSRPILYLVKRGSQPGALEYALKEQALDSGVRIHFDERRSPQEVKVWAVGAQHRGRFLGVGLRFQTHHPDAVKLLIGARHAPKAYAYLFIQDGEGEFTVVLTRDFVKARAYLQAGLAFFQRVMPFDMVQVRVTSGFGGRMDDFWRDDPALLRVGEAAGFQDYLWGFGIRFAMHSGVLAGQALVDGSDYDRMARSQIHPVVHASLINRAFYDRAGDRVYLFMIRWLSRSPRFVEELHKYYGLSIPDNLLWLLQRFQSGAPAQTR